MAKKWKNTRIPLSDGKYIYIHTYTCVCIYIYIIYVYLCAHCVLICQNWLLMAVGQLSPDGAPARGQGALKGGSRRSTSRPRNPYRNIQTSSHQHILGLWHGDPDVLELNLATKPLRTWLMWAPHWAVGPRRCRCHLKSPHSHKSSPLENWQALGQR